MAKRLNDQADVKTAVSASNSLGALAGTKIDTTGFSRARFIFTFGSGLATTGAVSGNVGVWKAATSGGTFASVPTAILATVSSGVMSGASPSMVIDMPTDAANPWLLVSGNISSTGLHHSAVVELYDGINRPPTSSAQQLVTI
jgi:hypothetical protein